MRPTQPTQHDRDMASNQRKLRDGGSRPSQGGDNRPSSLPARRTWLTFLIILGVNYLLMRLLFPSPDEPITIPCANFKEQVRSGNVQAIYSKGSRSTRVAAASADGGFSALPGCEAQRTTCAYLGREPGNDVRGDHRPP